ncbi:MAG: hypothetical protein HY332_22180 [Chloroflexi bacterium]|nr:hypothetical protein [Chloroflexota bacterium]
MAGPRAHAAGGAERPEYEPQIVTARSRLDENAFASAWAQGEAMPLYEVIAHALAG